ncbi:hypothetical protein [Actinocrinis sp.]|nr:hypothetical protein [Actinocrinis sp.]
MHVMTVCRDQALVASGNHFIIVTESCRHIFLLAHFTDGAVLSAR